MRLHYLQHVCFEDLGYIKTWAEGCGMTISRTAFFADEPLPGMTDFDGLIILGGPMGVDEEQRYPWLIYEKLFIKQAIAAGKTVLGICLGAQLIAAAMGARVYGQQYKEIGWIDVSLTESAGESKFFGNLPASFPAFHWHGETFDLPREARRLAQSAACPNQAFELNEKVLALQFHLESTPNSIASLIENCGEDMVPGKFVQNPEQIRAQNDNTKRINPLMEKLLDNTFLEEVNKA